MFLMECAESLQMGSHKYPSRRIMVSWCQSLPSNTLNFEVSDCAVSDAALHAGLPGDLLNPLKVFQCAPPWMRLAGLVSREDLDLVLRQLAGTCLSEKEVGELVQLAFEEAGAKDQLSLEDFSKALKGRELNMVVEIPVQM
eukprot:evm.model.scf_437EXC.10 EVM.evm.TU.scf_437EXC.10   scf_437EXC:65310-65732(-)